MKQVKFVIKRPNKRKDDRSCCDGSRISLFLGQVLARILLDRLLVYAKQLSIIVCAVNLKLIGFRTGRGTTTN